MALSSPHLPLLDPLLPYHHTASGRSKDSHNAGFVPSELNLRREMGAIKGGLWVLYGLISQNLSRHNTILQKELRKS